MLRLGNGHGRSSGPARRQGGSGCPGQHPRALALLREAAGVAQSSRGEPVPYRHPPSTSRGFKHSPILLSALVNDGE